MITQLDLDEGHSISQAQRELAAVKELLKSPGWEILEAYAKEQCYSRQHTEGRVVPTDIGTFLQREQLFGTIAGIELFCAFPLMLKDGLENLIVQLKKEPTNVESD